ncbi:SHOCT domain-containing protein [Streptomyces sp. NPDC055749]
MSDQLILAYDFPVLGTFWTLMWVFLWIMWLMLLFRIIVDIFRNDTSGWAKAGWLLFVLITPFLGALVYVIACGKGMGQREINSAKAQREAFDSYVRETAHSGERSTTHELSALAELRAKGDLTEAEFEQAKQKTLR